MAPFTNNVYERRNALKWSQDKLAEEAATNRITIARLEAQRIEPPASTMFRIARALGADFEDVFQYVDEKPPIITRALRSAGEIGKALAMVCVALITLVAGIHFAFRYSGDYHTLHHQPQLASWDYQAADFFANPILFKARFDALESGQSIRVGMGRGYLTALPSLTQCRTWLQNYGDVAAQSDPSDAVGEALHLDYADCLDRVHATQEAVAERERMLNSHKYLLTQAAPVDFYLIVRQASLAYQMQDQPAALRLAALAHDTHPDLYQKMLALWKNAKTAPFDMRSLIALNRDLATTPMFGSRI